MKILLVLFFALYSSAIAQTPTPSPSPVWINSNVSLKCDSTCTPDEVKEVDVIAQTMNIVIQSSCFQQFFEKQTRIDMAQGFSADAIVSILRKPQALTLNYFYRKWAAPFVKTKEEGYEDASDFSVIHFNRYFTQNWAVCDKASLGAHELSHSKGFFHNGNLAAPNYYTVPYTVNHAFDSCCPSLVK